MFNDSLREEQFETALNRFKEADAIKAKPNRLFENDRIRASAMKYDAEVIPGIDLSRSLIKRGSTTYFVSDPGA